LSFNYRVLLEAEDDRLPIYERLKFLSIYASNLEEFYKIRVSEHRSIIMRKIHSEEDPAESEQTLEEVKREVTRQQGAFTAILENKILPALRNDNIILYMDSRVEPFHTDFIRHYFVEEIFPFLQPVMIMKDDIRVFIRDNRLYQVVHLKKTASSTEYYALIKIPYAKVPRFIELPSHDGNKYFMFTEDVISANLQYVFPGFEIAGSYNIKISRDADIYIDEEIVTAQEKLVETIIKKVKRRKIGDLSRFVYDREMPSECLHFLCDVFAMQPEDLIPDNRHLNMEDLVKLPNTRSKTLEQAPLIPIEIPALITSDNLLNIIKKQDIFLFYPYHTFNHFIRFLCQASSSPEVEEIYVTQYRVAENSEVITNLINAAQHGKKVTVFVELKARFDEENNLYSSEAMKQAGIRIIYSLPGLKVHAKVALVKEKSGLAYAYLSTGNFNEKTASIYSDMSVMTSNRKLTDEILRVFDVLKGRVKKMSFHHILVSQFNMVPTLKELIQREIAHVQQGRKGYIILKMNGLQDKDMIDELYKASEAGVEIDLIVRGICCLVPNQPFSKNIRITRIVDMFLEHARIWYFFNDGQQDLFLSSADWMRRNLYRRIETAFPVWDKQIKALILEILDIQLQDNVKACRIDEHLRNDFKRDATQKEVWSQKEIYRLLVKQKDLFTIK
jgi:polyphosphate kinase